MRRMTERDRLDFFNAGTSPAVKAGEIMCDECDEQAVAPSHQGSPDRVRCHCAKHYMAWIADLRRSRPSGAELAARVNAAIGA